MGRYGEISPHPQPHPRQVLATLRGRLQEALAHRPLSFTEFKRAVARAEHGCSDTRSSHSLDTPRGPAAQPDPRDLSALLDGLQAGGLEALKSLSSTIGDWSTSLLVPGR